MWLTILRMSLRHSIEESHERKKKAISSRNCTELPCLLIHSALWCKSKLHATQHGIMYAPKDQDIISGAIHVHRRSNHNNDFAVSSIFFSLIPFSLVLSGKGISMRAARIFLVAHNYLFALAVRCAAFGWKPRTRCPITDHVLHKMVTFR